MFIYQPITPMKMAVKWMASKWFKAFKPVLKTSNNMQSGVSDWPAVCRNQLLIVPEYGFPHILSTLRSGQFQMLDFQM
jgi:hypothetical protein